MAYIDLIVLVVLLVFVIIYAKRFQTYIFGFGMIDILFRILNVVRGYIPVKTITNFIDTYIPASIPAVISKYTSGMVEMGITLVYVAIMIVFLYFIIKIFIKRKKF